MAATLREQENEQLRRELATRNEEYERIRNGGQQRAGQETGIEGQQGASVAAEGEHAEHF